jgi:predicted metal-dependent phosphoesterase TrpH
LYEFDLHTHTSNYSACGQMSIEELIEAAMAEGLAGVCVTDHNYQWGEDELRAALRRCGDPPLILLPGVEITAAEPRGGPASGHFLVYGLPRPVRRPGSAGELIATAHEAGGFVVAAHPLRPGSSVGMAIFDLNVDAVEVYNLQNTQRQTDGSRLIAEQMGVPAVAGSDGHRAAEVGLYRTCFERPVRSIGDLAAEIRAERFVLRSMSPVVF